MALIYISDVFKIRQNILSSNKSFHIINEALSAKMFLKIILIVFSAQCLSASPFNQEEVRETESAKIEN